MSESNNSSQMPFLRDSLQDKGALPNNEMQHISPDIAIQTFPFNPAYIQEIFGEVAAGKDIGNNVYTGQTNYVYMRASNPTEVEQVVDFDLYHCSPTLLVHPINWKVYQKIGSIKKTVLKPRSVTAAGDPFMWVPAHLPTGTHYTVVGEMTYAGQPGIPGEFPDLDTWWDYCRQHNTIAYRSIEKVEDLMFNRMERWLSLLNPDNKPRKYSIEANCTLPVGSQVTLYCPSRDLDPNIRFSWTITQTQETIATPEIVFPPWFRATFQLMVTFPQKMEQGSFTICLQQFGDVRSELAKQWKGQRGMVNSELVLVGSYTFQIDLNTLGKPGTSLPS